MALFKFLVIVFASVNLHADEGIQAVVDDFLPGVELGNLLDGQKEQVVILSAAEQNEIFGRQLTESESAKVNNITNQYETLKRRLIAREYVLEEILKMVKGVAAWDSRLINQLTGFPVGYRMSPVMQEFISKGAFDVQALFYEVTQESIGLDIREDFWAKEGIEVSTLFDRVRSKEKELLESQDRKNTSGRLSIVRGDLPGVISLLDELRILRFHQAVERRHRTVVVTLLNGSSFDINAPDSEGRTALYKAASQGDYQMVDLLIERGAGVNILSGNAKTPLDGVNVKLKEVLEKVQTLRENGEESKEDLLLKSYELKSLERAEAIHEVYSKIQNRLIQEGGREFFTRVPMCFE